MNRLGLVVLWFALQFAWNLITKQPSDINESFGFRCVDALSYLTTPIQLLTSIIAMVAIWKRVWNRKSLAERLQAKAEAEAEAPPDEPDAR
jgi:hypothetical protein